jgi:hypothetical protein
VARSRATGAERTTSGFSRAARSVLWVAAPQLLVSATAAAVAAIPTTLRMRRS